MEIVALFLAALIGVSLGFLGGGGSTLAVPILVYVARMPPKAAIAASLFVVGVTSLLGAWRHARAKNIDLRVALIFGAVSMAGAYAGGKLANRVSDDAQLMLFAVVMLGAAISMLLPERPGGSARRVRLSLVFIAAAAVGTITGLVGVGGGFLIVPALVVFAGVPMRRAVGTSLAVITLNCAAAFVAYTKSIPIDWSYTALFTGMALLGVVAGSSLAHRVSAEVLRRSFAIFLIALAVFILARGAS